MDLPASGHNRAYFGVADGEAGASVNFLNTLKQ